MNRRSRIVPPPGQESAWKSPPPPRIEVTDMPIRVVFNGVCIAETRRALRVLETGHPPVYYIPPEDIQMEYLSATDRHAFNELKGAASYYSITVGDQTAINAAWYYISPVERYAALKNHVAFDAGKVEGYVNDERVEAQAGNLGEGWITGDVVGPFGG